MFYGKPGFYVGLKVSFYVNSIADREVVSTESEMYLRVFDLSLVNAGLKNQANENMLINSGSFETANCLHFGYLLIFNSAIRAISGLKVVFELKNIV